jgi:replicative DNA helicase
MADNLPKKSLRIPPQSLESEMALIGSIMMRPEAINEVLDKLNPHSFYSERNRMIFEMVWKLHQNSEPIDLLTVSQKLKERNQLDQVGGRTYLTQILESVPSSANIRFYAEIVEKKHRLRQLISSAEHISALGFNEHEELDIILDKAEKSIFEITNYSNTQTLIAMKDTLGDAWERIDRLHKSTGELRGIPTGFAGLDNKLAGLQKSDLIILAARPSMGKTSLALDIARNTAVKYKTPVVIFSLEMSSQQLIDRMLASQAKVDAWKLRRGRLSREEDFDNIRDALDTLSQAPIFIDDKPANNILTMRSTCRKLKSEQNLGLIVVDYLQLMVPNQSRNSDNVVQQVTEISRSLKALAREMDVPVLALSQLSRAVEQRGGRPRLSDLRDSGSIEQDADVVMFIHREDKMKEESERNNIAEILIEKHRNGPTGKVDLYFDEKKTTFVDIETNQHDASLDDF